MKHIYEDNNLSFFTLKRIMLLFSENDWEIFEKLDSQILFGTFCLNTNRFLFARSQKDFDNFGLTEEELLNNVVSKEERGSLSKACSTWKGFLRNISRENLETIFRKKTFFKLEFVDPGYYNILKPKKFQLFLSNSGHFTYGQQDVDITSLAHETKMSDIINRMPRIALESSADLFDMFYPFIEQRRVELNLGRYDAIPWDDDMTKNIIGFEKEVLQTLNSSVYSRKEEKRIANEITKIDQFFVANIFDIEKRGTYLTLRRDLGKDYKNLRGIFFNVGKKHFYMSSHFEKLQKFYNAIRFNKFNIEMPKDFEKTEKVGIYPGSFKPPRQEDYENLLYEFKDCNEIKILISSKPKNNFLPYQSYKIFKEVIEDKIDKKLSIMISENIYNDIDKIVKENPKTLFTMLGSDEERFKILNVENINYTGIKMKSSLEITPDNIYDLFDKFSKGEIDKIYNILFL